MELRNDMTREHAIYVWCWFSSDAKIDQGSATVEFEGTLEENVVPLCVFPGLRRRFKKEDGVTRDACVAPVKVELE